MKFGLPIVLFAGILILIAILYVYILVPPLFQKKPYWEFVRVRQNRMLGRILKNNLLFGIAYLLIAIFIILLVTHMTIK